jgi:hypothetical protein
MVKRIGWNRPGNVALAAVIILINLVVDWRVFKPQSLPMFVAIEAVVYRRHHLIGGGFF